jgi:hypothetical protein
MLIISSINQEVIPIAIINTVYMKILSMACYAWNQLAQNIDLVKSIMYRDWINTPC